MTISRIQSKIKREFSKDEDWMVKYQRIIDYGRDMPKMKSSDKKDDNLVKGCQSKIWVSSELIDGKVYFSADSDTVITKGIVSLLITVLNGQKPEDIIKAKLKFIDGIGLRQHLTPSRVGGLGLMIGKLKELAQTYVKKKLLVSFSGGETSAYMAKWLKDNKSDEYEMIFVFANTGQENEETLNFVNKCDKEFNLGVVWVEAAVRWGVRAYGTKYYFDEQDQYQDFLSKFKPEEFEAEEIVKHIKCKDTGEHKPIYQKCVSRIQAGTKHSVVDYETADRSGRVFEDTIKKFMIPNLQNMTCTREMKERPITSYARSIGWKRSDYQTAIGIRSDEIDRVSKNKDMNNLIYPLVSMKEMTKPKVNAFWNDQSFRLELKGYQGNCKTCWKKSFRKLGTIAKENPEHFDFFRKMEGKYSEYVSEGRRGNDNLKPPFSFFRGHNDTDYIFNEVITDPKFKPAEDDSTNYDYDKLSDGNDLDISNGCSESCEVF